MRFRRTAPRLAVTALMCGLCVGCTSKDDNTQPVSTSPAPTSTAPATTLTRKDAPFTVTIAQLGDGVHNSDRRHLRAAIGAPVSSWFNAGFLAPTYPTGDFPAAFASWTRRAAQQAGRDNAQTTNATLGPDLVALVADRQQATLYVFAHSGVTGGATARVRLVLTGEKQDGSLVKYAVSGDVYLTRDKTRWRIFGYDLHQSKEAP